ncbi:MAG: RluA family pseudouridine synthase, partial [Bacteroidales bacterium]|nr:RluA family pseudouridine synthase [Bacteroidales bacterium]
LYEDNHLLVVNKRPGEIVQGDKTGDECLSESYKAFVAQRDSKPGAVFMGVPHRLDRPVSGICILAKTSKALSRLSEMFRTGSVHKTYWALCCGAPAEPEGLLEDWLVRNEKQNKSYVTRAGGTPATAAHGTSAVAHGTSATAAGPAGAKLARLKYRHLGDTDRYHLLEIELLTGRHHQIRCQLSHIGCVIKGDLKYGAPRSNPDGGICLHARQIEFIHPVRGEQLTITAPLPSSWPPLD